jgi:phage gp45-like
MKTVEQLARSTDPALVRAFGMIRRFVITLTDTAIWQIAGVLMPDGRETMRAEVFGGVGIHARPPASVEAEAIVAMGGDATNPVIVGLRDEKTRSASAGDLEADETALFNTLARVHVKADGTIELRQIAGLAPEKMVRGETYRTSEDVVFTAMATFAAAISTFAATCTGPTPAQLATLQTAATTFETAVTTFQAAAAEYLSVVGKVQ